MKTFIFVRGVDTPFKQQVVKDILATCNPDINSITAITVSMKTYLEYDGYSLDNDYKAASSSCKRLVKKLLSGSHHERFIIIDNESLRPQDWESFIQIASRLEVSMKAIGIDVTNVKFNSPENITKLNLQEENLDTFILSCSKYYKINCSDDISSVKEQFVSDFNI